jgi:hypothetical protein
MRRSLSLAAPTPASLAALFEALTAPGEHNSGGVSVTMPAPSVNDLTTYLVSCVSKKGAAAASAKNLYVSEWFLRVRRYVEATGCPWFILSAKYGLIDPNQIIAPYGGCLARC